MQDKHDGSQQFVHALPIANITVLLGIAEQDIQERIPGGKWKGCVCMYVGGWECVHECVCVYGCG